MDEPHTLTFPIFWSWIVTHANCILRAGTPETVIYDDEDLHWHFAAEGPDTLVVQILRGKRLVGELLLAPDQISHVEGQATEEPGEYVFELVAAGDSDPIAAYFFVLTHGWDEDSASTPTRVH